MSSIGTGARVVHMLLLSAWFGGCLLFVAVIAPNIFSIVPSREVAGDLVTVTLRAIDTFGMIASPVLLVTLLMGWMSLGSPLKLRALGIVLMGTAAALSGRWITPQMLRLRHAMPGPIETVPATDPLKIEFASLHTWSTVLLAAHFLIAAVLLVLAIAGTTPKGRGGIEL